MIQYSWYNIKKPAFFNSITSWLELCVSQLFTSVNNVHYIFCDDNYILTINREQLDHDYFTDIITFDYREDESEPLECEIFVSIDTVRDNSFIYETSFQEELMRVVVHGLLHMCGYNDSTDSEKSIMRTEENKLISLYNSSTWNNNINE